MRTTRLITTLLSGFFALLPGCNIVSAMTYFFSPPQVQPAEFKLTEGRLAVFIETVQPEQANSVFMQALCDKLVEIFREHQIKAQLVPQEEIFRLRQQNRDFAKWSLQKVGQRLGAKQLLYVRIEEFQLRDTPDMPILHPAVRMRLTVVDPAAAADKARLWPGAEESEGREVSRARQQREAGDPLVLDEEAAKLGKDAAYVVAAPFYDVDLERKTPWEP
jgi:hypothetical protein